MSRNKMKEEYYRSFTVADPRTHEKGHTEYRVTARFVSKRHPEDVKEVAVWRRFSELKKLHGELSYTHRNLFRREEVFPHFPRAQVFGRFEETVIEERRKAAESMLTFSTNIPALYNSPQLKDFFRGGEVTRPLDPSSMPTSSSPLPPPLIPLPRRRASDCEPVEEQAGTEAPALHQDLGSSSHLQGEGLELGQPEVAAEAYHEMEMEDTPTQEEEEEEEDELSHASLNDEGPSPDPPCCTRAAHQSQESREEFDSLFDSMGEGHVPSPPPPPPPPLSDNDLAIFDPCCKQDQVTSPNDHSELFSLPLANQDTGEAGYLTEAANELTVAIEREREGEYSSAILRYRTAVDILITGVKGDSDPGRRELVKRRTAQYLKHAEMLVDTHASPTHTHAHTQQHP